MNLFDLKYYFFGLDYLKYIFLFLLINWFLEKSFIPIITLNTIVRFFMTGTVLYLLFIFKIKKKKNTGNEIQEKLDIIKEPNLYHIYKDIGGVLLYSDILDIRNLNKYSFNKSMKHYDNFIKIKNNILKGVKFPKNYHDILEDEMSKSLNALSSISVGIGPKTFYDENETNKQNKNLKLNKLNKSVKELYNLFYQHLKEINKFLKNKWNNSEIDNTSFPIYESNIKPNMIHTKNYSSHYSIL